MNQKFKIFGHLNVGRRNAGVIESKKHLYVFGGYNKEYLDSIERVSLETGGIFEPISH